MPAPDARSTISPEPVFWGSAAATSNAGRGWSTVVEHTPSSQGSNPRLFFLLQSFLSFLHQWSVLIRFFKEVHLYVTMRCEIKNGCLAVVSGARRAQYAQIGQKTSNAFTLLWVSALIQWKVYSCVASVNIRLNQAFICLYWLH